MSELRSAHAKLERAQEHIAQYLGLANEFRRSNPYTVREKKDSSGRNKPYTFIAPIPPGVICAAGDAVHNLRSALDHVATALAVRAGFAEKALLGVNFTIRKTRKAFDDAVSNRVIQAIAPGWVDFLRSVEPYQEGRGEDLQRVSALDNIDKHRDLLAVVPYFNAAYIEPGGVMRRERISLEEGVPGSLAIWSSDPKHAMAYGFDITLADARPGQETEAVVELRNFASSVAFVIGKAAQKFF